MPQEYKEPKIILIYHESTFEQYDPSNFEIKFQNVKKKNKKYLVKKAIKALMEKV